jgi:hypothetical protein
MARGIRGRDAKVGADQFRKGDLYCGGGLIGTGTYCAVKAPDASNTPIDDAKFYAGTEGVIMRLHVDTAKLRTITPRNVMKAHVSAHNLLERIGDQLSSEERHAFKEIAKDDGRMAMLLGYDAIDPREIKPYRNMFLLLRRDVAEVEASDVKVGG